MARIGATVELATEKKKEDRNDYDDEHGYIDHPFSAGPSEKSAFDGPTTCGTDIRLLADLFPTIGTLYKCHARLPRLFCAEPGA